MAPTPHSLISDRDTMMTLVHALLDTGYYPVPVGGGDSGKIWCLDDNDEWMARPVAGSPPDIERVIGFFSKFNTCGVGVAVPWLRDLDDKLIALDVDVEDEATWQAVATIIGTPCPVKRGGRGLTFFMRAARATQTDPVALLKSRGARVESFDKPTRLNMPRYKYDPSDTKEAMPGFEFLSNKVKAHTVLPPSLHLAAGRPYEWVPFPGTSAVMPLERTNPADLPEFKEWHLMLLHLWAKNNDAQLWSHLGKSSAGEHHEMLLPAIEYLWNERLTEDELFVIMEREAALTADSDKKLRERCTEIKNAIRGTVARHPEQKPSRPSGKGLKVPLARLIVDWLLAKYPRDALAMFNSDYWHWNGTRWHQVNETRQIGEPFYVIREQIFDEFDTADPSVITSALKEFRGCFKPREAEHDPNIIPFQNAVLDIRAMELRPERKEDHILSRLSQDYDPGAVCEEYDKYVERLLQPPQEVVEENPDDWTVDWSKAIQTLNEFLGYCLVRSYHHQRMLFMSGTPGTGKSVLGILINKLLPAGWVSNVQLDDMDNPNVMLNMVNSHINVDSEMGRGQIRRDIDGMLLSITSGEPILVHKMNEFRIPMRIPARLFSFGNYLPTTSDSSGAFARRAIILRSTDNTFTQEERVLDYHNILMHEAPGIINRWLGAYLELEERGYFDLPDYSKTAIQQVTEESNSVAAWVDARCDRVDDLKDGTHSEELYRDYQDWCMVAGYERARMMPPTWGKVLVSMKIPSRLRRLPGGKMARFRALKLVQQHGRVAY